MSSSGYVQIQDRAELYSHLLLLPLKKQIFLFLFVLAAFNKWLVCFICGYIQVLGTHENAVIFIRGIPPTTETH